MTSMDPVAALLARDHFGIKLGLDNIHVLCEALGHPERSAPTVIVAGTNGKGSVTAFVSSALTAAGYRVGRYTSPHLVRIEERFALDGTSVATATLAEALDRVVLAEQACRDDGCLPVPATFFELTTAAAFEVFRRAAVDVMVLDAEYFLAIRTEGTRTIRGTQVDVESSIGDYKDVGGLMFPHSVKSGTKGSPQKQKMTITKIDLNAEIDDTRFKMPAKAQQ